VTVCDLGGGGQRLLYKGVEGQRPSVPCRHGPAAAAVAEGPTEATPGTPQRGAPRKEHLPSSLAAAVAPHASPALRASVHMVHIYHGRRPDGRLGFMYAPIVRTLVQGINASSRRGMRIHVGEVDTAADATSAFQRSMLRLGPRDTFVWVGAKQHAAPPWAQMRALGVHRVYYQTEPLPRGGGCMLPPGRRPRPPTVSDAQLVDEVWDYSLWNLEQCGRATHAPLLRHVPPGAYGAVRGGTGPAAVTERTATAEGNAQARGASPRAMFLGDATLEERPSCFPPLRHLVSPVNDVWSEASLRQLIATSTSPVFVNIHKRCLHDEATQPLESVRIAMLLSAGAIVLSQHAAPHDEALFDGIVEFASLDAMPRAISALLARPDLHTLARERHAKFRRRFEPGTLLAKALSIGPWQGRG
jgi:hypothetical protein